MTYKEPLDIWHLCRSREGAWIEIENCPSRIYLPNRRSREGAWIEIGWW